MSPLRPSPLILPLLLLGAGVFMLLSALALEPAAGGHGEASGAAAVDDHGAGEAAADDHAAEPAVAGADDHAEDAAGVAVDGHADEAASAIADDHSDEAAADAHADEAAGTVDDHAATGDGHATATSDHGAGAAEVHGDEGTAAATDGEHGAGGAAAATDDHGEAHAEDAGSFLGIDLDEVNMASPRLAVIAIAVSILLGVLLLFWRNRPVLLAVAVVSLALAVVEAREALRAGDEHGIVVPLQALAVVLHLAAAALAVLALRARRAPAERDAPATMDHDSALPAHGQPA